MLPKPSEMTIVYVQLMLHTRPGEAEAEDAGTSRHGQPLATPGQILSDPKNTPFYSYSYDTEKCARICEAIIKFVKYKVQSYQCININMNLIYLTFPATLSALLAPHLSFQHI